MPKKEKILKEPKWHGWPEKVTEAGFFYLFEQLKIRGVDRLFFRYSQYICGDPDNLEDFLEWDWEGHPEDSIEDEEMRNFTVKLDSEGIMIMHVMWAHEMYFSRMVENFIIYLQDIIAAIYQKHPHLINLERRIEFREVVASINMNNFFRRSGHEKIDQLSRGGFDELVKEVNRLLYGILSQKEIKHLKLIMGMRNALIHRRGRSTNLINSIRRKTRKPEATTDLRVIGLMDPVSNDLYQAFTKVEASSIKRYALSTSDRKEIFKRSDMRPDMRGWTS